MCMYLFARPQRTGFAVRIWSWCVLTASRVVRAGSRPSDCLRYMNSEHTQTHQECSIWNLQWKTKDACVCVCFSMGNSSSVITSSLSPAPDFTWHQKTPRYSKHLSSSNKLKSNPYDSCTIFWCHMLALCEEQTDSLIFPSNLQHTFCLPALCHHQFTDREESMVAMDFSGKSGGRVIQNPHEAQNAEQEEGQNWRVCMCMCSRETMKINSLNRIHATQCWNMLWIPAPLM